MSFFYALLAGLVMAFFTIATAAILGALGHPIEPGGPLGAAMILVVVATVVAASVVLHVDYKRVCKRQGDFGGHHG